MRIIKVGGGSAINLPALARDLAAHREEPTIVVHGANALRDELAAKLGCEVRTVTSVSGVSSVYSDDRAIDLLMLAYAGLRNKRLVELLQQNGINAVGLSGLDGRVIEGERNAPFRVRENGKTLLVRDNSGKPKRVNTTLLTLLMDNGFTPVLTVPISDDNGRAINTDNDDIVARLHHELHADTILHLIEAPGLLRDRADPNSCITNLTVAELTEWESRVEGRMRRKIMAIRKLFEGGGAKVIVADGRGDAPLSDALSGRGTTIQ